MIRTDRLVLRPAHPGDLNALHRILSNPEAMRYWDRPAHTDIAETRAFLDAFMNNDPDQSEEYILDLDGRCIGKAGVWRKPELGYIIDPAHWQQGFASEALRAILPRCFEKWPDLKALTAEIDPRNVASERLLERFGFVCVRVGEKDFLYGDTWCDTAYYEVSPAGFTKSDALKPVR